MKRIYFIFFLTFVIFTLTIVQIVVSNSLSTSGISLANVNREINQYKKENTFLRERLLEASSLTNIEKKALTMGFGREGTEFVIVAPLPLALKR